MLPRVSPLDRRRRGPAIGAVLVACSLAASGAGLVGAAPASAATSDLAVIYGVGAKRTLFASGRLARAPQGVRVVLESRSGKRVKTRVAGKLRQGRLNLRWRYPSGARTLSVRVRVLRTKGKQTVIAGRWQTISVGKLPKPRSIAKVQASQVQSIPPPGQPGRVVLGGAARVSPGQVIALGASSQTPNGLLVRATNVSRPPGQTVADTVPATLPEVLPVGSMDVTLLRDPAARRRAPCELESQWPRAPARQGILLPERPDDAGQCVGVALDRAKAPGRLESRASPEDHGAL